MITVAEKKNKGRFTIQFNSADPQQQKAVELLEQQGRHKAQFLTSVILHYIHCEATPDITQAIPLTNEELEKHVVEILRRLSAEQLKADNVEDFSVDTDTSQKTESELESIFGPEVSSAISNTLSAFYRE